MKSIRILIADLPRTPRDIIRETFDAEPDMVVVGEVGTGESIENEVQRTGASVVIVDSANAEAGLRRPPLLARAPSGLNVVALGSEGREIFLQATFGESSLARLLHTIRQLHMTPSEE